jgi:stage III sporulation protein AA
MIQMKKQLAHWKNAIFSALPDNLQKILNSIPDDIEKGLEEIRIREHRPLMVCSCGRDFFVHVNGKISAESGQAYQVTSQDVHRIVQLISNYSIYAFEEELRNGYITLTGGYRVGLTGKTVLEGGKIKSIKHINSFNFRITRQVLGAADKVLFYVTKSGNIYHTLILSPPQMGKTTLLRDLARQLSDGFAGFNGVKVGIVDERSEIAGCYQGVPQNQVGLRSDVLDACPKADGIMMLIRSMSPNVIITDEIGRIEDVYAIEEALNAGVKVITTAHSRDLQDAQNRPILKQLLSKKIFERILVLGNTLGVGTVEKIYDTQTMNNLLNVPIR